MNISFDDYLAHYGTPRHSGRYPWGSGDNAQQNSTSFLGMVEDLEKKGLKPTEIVDALGLKSTTVLRRLKTIAKSEERARLVSMIERLAEKGYSHGKIAERLGLAGESSVRALRAPGALDKAKALEATANMLREQVEKKKYLDVGVGQHYDLGVTKDKMKVAIAKLETEGYKIHFIPVRQLGTGLNTSMPVLAKPGVEWSEVWENRGSVRTISDIYTEDGGRSWLGIEPPKNLDPKRMKINFAEDGGDKADGIIHIRPGVDDVSLGGSRYAQVRIAVGGSHFMKGMAFYRDDLPPGVDVVFNSNKKRGTPVFGEGIDTVLKPMKKLADGSVDMENPFGTSLSRQHGVMNLVGSPNKEGAGEEGSWATWSKSLSSQFLSKQPTKLAQTQLKVTQERRQSELDEIKSLTNPVVRKYLLDKLAESTDSAAVHLKAAEMRGQGNYVILPIQTLKSTEIYAPAYDDGTRVAVVRFPHGGRFEIPELVVNNKNREGRKYLGPTSADAVGINPEVAKRLSGADFDGDTVLVIPNTGGQIKSKPALAALKDFDPIAAYPKYEGMKVMSNTNVQMGEISNLITDMTIKGASDDELARAVKHSMVVIDAEKHQLNYRLSAEENGISALRVKYQDKARGGASTIISRKKQEIPVPERKQGFKVDPKTGRRIYTPTGNSYVDPATGKTVRRTQKVKWLDEVDDAHQLRSGEPIVMEKIYADHSNKLKAIANEARRLSVNTTTEPRSPTARVTYKTEVQQLESKLNVALRNAPRERQAQVLAEAQVRLRRQAQPGMKSSEVKKIEMQALAEMRTRVGAKKTQIEITPTEWDAIQASAISPSKLTEILKHADLEQVKQYATPKTAVLMTDSKQALATQLLGSGKFTQAEVAQRLGVSLTTLKKGLGG